MLHPISSNLFRRKRSTVARSQFIAGGRTGLEVHMSPNISSQLTIGIGIGESDMRAYVNKVAFVALAVGVCLLGCRGQNDISAAPVSFVSKYAPIKFTFPAGWYENPEEHPFDLQCFSRSQRMSTGVYAFKKVDLAVDSSPIDILWLQIDDLKSKRKHFEEFEAIQKHEDGDKTVTSVTYLGDKGSSRNCYRFSLIEFKEDESQFAVVLQVAIPGDWDQSEPILKEITKSAQSLDDDK